MKSAYDYEGRLITIDEFGDIWMIIYPNEGGVIIYRCYKNSNGELVVMSENPFILRIDWSLFT